MIYLNFNLLLIFCQICLAKNHYERDRSKFKKENFILDYFDKNLPDFLQIDQKNINLPMEPF